VLILNCWRGSSTCTTEHFDFDDGTLQGWSTFGNAGVSGGAAVFGDSPSGSWGANGIQMAFAGGFSLELSYNWSASSGSGYTTNQYNSVSGSDGSSVRGTGYYGNCLYCTAAAVLRGAALLGRSSSCGRPPHWRTHCRGAPSRLKYIWLTHGLTIGVSQIALIISRLPYAGMFQARIRPPQNPPCLQPRRRQAIQPRFQHAIQPRFQHDAPRACHRAFQPLPPLERQVECPQMFQPRVPPCKK